MMTRPPEPAALATWLIMCACIGACDVPDPPFVPTRDTRGGNDGGPLEQPFCTPGDNAFCSYKGACNAAGSACECSDPVHYSPADRCATWREAVLSEGQVCRPGDRVYCYHTGTCDPDGKTCICDDPEHRSPIDNCNAWYVDAPADPADASDASDDSADPVVCTPGDRAHCYYSGACDPAGHGCVCDDPKHHSPADDCEGWYDYLPDAQGG